MDIDPPYIVIVPEEGEKLAPEPTLSDAVTSKLLDVVTVAEAAIAKTRNCSVPELEIDDPFLIVMVPPVGASVVEALTVNAPPTEKLAEGCVVGVPAMVSPLKVNVPELLTDHPVPVIVIVPSVGVNLLPAVTVSVPANKKLAEGGVCGVPAMVRPLKVNIPELLRPHKIPVMVIVPAEGEKFAPDPTFKAPAILKLLDVVTVADVAIVNPWKVSVPELLIDEPLFMVIVPAEGIKLPLPLTISAVATAKLFDVTTPVPLMVRLP